MFQKILFDNSVERRRVSSKFLFIFQKSAQVEEKIAK